MVWDAHIPYLSTWDQVMPPFPIMFLLICLEAASMTQAPERHSSGELSGLLASSVSKIQSWLLQPFGGKPVDGRSVSVSASLALPFK